MVIKSKRVSVFAIIFAIALSGLTGVYAEDEYIQGFEKIYTYTDGQFSDVSSEWFSNSVRQAYEIGLMFGNSPNTFNPAGNIDNAAVIAIAARLHSTYKSDDENFDSGSSNWYEPYMNYAINNGICDSNINPNDISTRGFFVGILGNAIDDSILKQKNIIDNGALSDVSGWYSNAVYTFYRAGILCGNDKYGTFAPDSPITRAEVAAIVIRLVKPTERVETVLVARPTSTYSIMEDNGSLEAYKQRAILANLKWLLNDEPQGIEWQNDIWSVDHAGIPGDEIHIDKWDIELTYEGDVYYVNVPKRYFGEDSDAYKLVGLWNLYTGFRSFLSGYTGSMPDGKYGDLYLSRPAVAAYTEKYTYSSFTKEAQYLINMAPHLSVIDEKVVKNYVDKTYGTAEQNSLYIGYLTNLESNWYITYNKNNMYNPYPRENGNSNQSEFIFTPESSKLTQWCKNNYGKYVVALVAEDFKTPVFLARISGYPSINEDLTVKSWNYNNGQLGIEWNNIRTDFDEPITVYEQSEIEHMRDEKIRAEKKAEEEMQKEIEAFEKEYEDLINNGYAKVCKSSSSEWTSYLEEYDDVKFRFAKREGIEGYEYEISRSYNGPHIGFNLNSKKACVQVWYNGTEYGEQVITIPEPKEFDGDIYLPADEILNALEENGQGFERKKI